MKRISFLILLTVLLVALSSCACKHKEYSEATCTKPSICNKCEESVFEALGHTWTDATCVLPKTCSVCQKAEGEPLGHILTEATCVLSQTCSVCQRTSGEPLGHSWVNASCTAPKTCSRCQKTEGDPLEHSYKEKITFAATCIMDGTKKFSCEKCTDSYEEKYKIADLSANEIYDLAKKSAGEIITYNKAGNEIALGTGFLLDSDGKIVTNYHVIENAYSIKITINGITHNIKQVLAYDKNLDLAILKIDAKNLSVLPICYYEHAVGKTIYSFGSSKGLTSTFSQGIITYSNRDIEGIKYIQHDSAISSGNSGGPLINQYGEVIGINTWVVKDSQNLNFAISVNELKKLKYETPLTVSEFYDKEFTTIQRIKNYIIRNGEYDSQENEYVMVLGYSYSQYYNLIYTRCAYYNVADDQIVLAFVVNDSDAVLLNIDNELSGVYDWAYATADGQVIVGTLNANNFTENSTLPHDDHNYTSSSQLSAAKDLALAMIVELCEYLNEDLAVIEVTAKDLGFTNF